jgi:hypothetical protein
MLVVAHDENPPCITQEYRVFRAGGHVYDAVVRKCSNLHWQSATSRISQTQLAAVVHADRVDGAGIVKEK